MTGDDRLVGHVVTAWIRWNQRPGSDHRARELGAAVRSLAGTHSTALRAHVTSQLRELGGGITGNDIRGAIHGWLDQQVAA